jgi:hypothetical protein
MKNLPLFSMLNQFTRQLEIPLVSQAQEALVSALGYKSPVEFERSARNAPSPVSP